ncbi:Molybdopterin-guanine dinucleotide biosynthesis protein MobA [Devosia sp. LC5]|uniref:molybdenum cofactor guanylyltransferase n=1 Tax=Devosia sp. LC5 TaxID=1502724 RepID=UPI0004E4707D|nr:NTP transferase domain-containing protein [Devosia sp. LC5]KFC69967.1 Molybdopterin-guanine dinucleotide biosynthesis protein MobA [Devosia sp. LC5]
MSAPYAVIIAGGQGQRLGGVRKGDLRIGGVKLVERVRRALGDVAEPLLLATGPGTLKADAGLLAVRDLDGPVGGPLAGLAAAVDALQLNGVRSGILVSVAVDTPFLPQGFAATMAAALGDAAAVYAAWDEAFYPPNAAWQLEALGALPGQVRDGTSAPSLKALHRQLDARRHDWRDRYEQDPFANLNTLADLIALQRRARNV